MNARSSRPSRCSAAVFVGCALGLAAAPARADGGIASLQLENDAPMEHDRHYTNGIRMAWLTPPLDPSAARRWAATLLPFTAESATIRFDFALGQSLFTPTNLQTANPDPTDRPYAAWLYLNAGLLAETATERDQLYLGLGLVGPSALGHEVQDLFHERDALGWRHQLRGEPTLELQYQHTWRIWRRDAGSIAFDVLPKAGFAVGTAHVFANAGLMVRAGYNLPDDFGPSLADPGLLGSTPFGSADGFSFYIFAAADGRAVAHNMFLDGGTFRDGPSVDSRSFVGDGQFGFVAQWDGVRLTASYVFRSDEFRAQAGDDSFASVTLSFRL